MLPLRDPRKLLALLQDLATLAGSGTLSLRESLPFRTIRRKRLQEGTNAQAANKGGSYLEADWFDCPKAGELRNGHNCGYSRVDDNCSQGVG